jgi:hypothetical protein
VSETINERVQRLAKGKPGFVNKAGKATGQPHSNVREEDFGKVNLKERILYWNLDTPFINPSSVITLYIP